MSKSNVSKTLRPIMAVGVTAMLGIMMYAVVTKPIARSDPNAPTVFIEDVTEKCLLVFEPDRNSFHACWPVLPEGVNQEVLPRGTTTLDIFQNPDLYIPKQG
jgi:hypothetical protein